MNVLVLYTRLTDYWMACLQHSRDTYNNTFLVYRYTPNPEAPFEIKAEKGIRIENIEAHKEANVFNTVDSFSPDVIYVAGWTNKTYLAIAKNYKKKGVPVVTGMDNHWKGTAKQQLAGLLSPWFIRPYFTDIWIPGSAQHPFAKKLGFKEKQIHKGLYCANANLFKAQQKNTKKDEVLFVGRLVAHKGVPELISLLKQFIQANTLNTKVHFIGNGPLATGIPKHVNIQHTPFVKPENLPNLLQNAGFFILPSTYEAWGVVVQEALLTGTPVISTHQCGAAIDLVKNGENGFLFDANNFKALEEIFKKIEKLSDEEYARLSENALSAGKQINHENWSKTLEKIANQ